MPVIRLRDAGRRLATPFAPALVALALILGATLPAPVAAATATMAPACAGVNLRTLPKTTSNVKAKVGTTARVTVTGTVAGTAWAAVCGGATSGRTWYRITAINGRTVKSLYGITAVFAATGTLKPASSTPVTPSPAPLPTPPPTDTVEPAAVTADAYGAELMRLVNLDRAALGLPAYPMDAGLVAIARDAAFTCPTNPSLVLRGRAADMADRSYFGHVVAGCYLAGTTTPYPSLDVVRQVFGYAQARSEILHWNTYGGTPTTYALGCDITGRSCAGGTTTTPYTVALAQRSFMNSSPHRTAELNAYQRFGCGSATVPGTTKTYFACLFADGASSWTPGASPAPAPAPAPIPSPIAGSPAMVAACAGVNLRTGASTAAAVAARLAAGTPVTVDAMVDGAAWSTECAGPKAGSAWYRVTAVGGTPVSALYGAVALYAAAGVLAAASPVPPAAPAAAAGLTLLGSSVTFYGRGWGHGVGLSQYGARGRALAGASAADILAHYYQGTTIGTVPDGMTVRVLLLAARAVSSAAPLTVVGRSGPWTAAGIPGVFAADARLRLFPPAAGATMWRAVVDAGSAVLYDGPAPADLRVAGTTDATTLELPARSATWNLYRGTLRILLAGSKADVVNELPLESYLRGVVPAEMASSWPIEARTAQTVAARSFAAYRLRPGVSTFDVYDDTRSQVYHGVRAETAAADAVIAATANQVLRFGAAVANALYHSTGGGATESNENVFVSATGAKVATPVPYLRGSPDRDPSGVPYDAAAPYATWQTRAYTPAELGAILGADARTNVGTLTALDLGNRGVSGRLVSVTLVGSAGAKTVSGDVFVTVFNAHRPSGDLPLRSSLLDVAPIP